jgi:hypothetical protein
MGEDVTLTVSTSDSTDVEQGDTVTVTFTYVEDSAFLGNFGEAEITIPSQMTVDSATPSGSGTYSSGTWSIGSAFGGSDNTLELVLTVNQEVVDQSFDVSGEATADLNGNPPGGDTSDDTASLTFTGPEELPIDNPDAPARVPFIDTLPTEEPQLFLDTNIRLRTKRNRQQENLLRDDNENVQFYEYRSASVNLATNTSFTLNLGGLDQGSYLMYESDQPIQAAFNGGTFLPKAEHMAITKGAITSLKLKNPSTSESAKAYVVVVD